MQEKAYADFVAYLRETATLKSCAAVLGWDRETNLPPGGTELRADQLALLAGMVHARETAPELRDLLAQASEQAEERSPAAVNIRETRWKLEREAKVPSELVEDLMRTATLARRAWMEARETCDYAIFKPWLEKMLALLRRKAAAIGYEQTPYDALLEEFEPGLTTADLERIFPPLKDAIVDLLERILGSDRPVDASLLERDYPVAAQEALVREVIEAIGFDMDRGRLDTSVHPMCAGTGPFDVRLMTRFNPSFFNEAFFGTLHEAGHGIYEQGLDPAHFGTPMGMHCSLGIHESQSRLWENLVGRSLGFLRRLFPRIQALFPEALGGAALEDFHRAVNRVEPTFIRVEADEVTYNLHIFLRVELEQALLNGDLEPADLPQAWNETFERYLKIRPPNDAEGCLQDIHWSAGLFAYFPTYTLGNLYAAQLFECARAELGNPEEKVGPLRSWLTERIHSQGKRYRAPDLIEAATGAPPTHEPLVRHLKTKYGAIYGLE